MAYVKKDWNNDEVITEAALDNMENGIAANDTKNTQQDTKISALEGKTGNATSAKPGIVKQATKVDAVSAANAGTIGDSFVKAEVQKVATLADANKTAINAVIAALKAAGIMANS